MWHYDGHHFWGMHWFWWILWVIFIFWIFATPYDIPGQRKKKEAALDILKKRLANGEISKEEYEDLKNTIERKN